MIQTGAPVTYSAPKVPGAAKTARRDRTDLPPMPKLKTKKSLKKRVWLTKTGKVRRCVAGTGHMQVSKTSKRRRRIRRTTIQEGAFAKKIRELIQE